MQSTLKVVMGLGKSGLSCVRYLVERGCSVAVTDSRQEPPGLSELRMQYPQVAISLGQFDEKLLVQADEIIVSPGVSIKEPVIAKQIAAGKSVIGDIELFARAVTAPVIAITGTNGKSTVTTLVGEMAKNVGCKVAVGGNLGTPALDLLADDIELYVLELSSFQLETTYSLHTRTATVLNISPDHLDRYENLTEYATAKQRIFIDCDQPIINRDDSASYSGLDNPHQAISFGLNSPEPGQFGLIQHSPKTYLAYGKEILLAADELQIKGRHQLANALAALALGSAANFDINSMLETLRNFKGLSHRCQWTANLNGVEWYNDSKGTNVSSSLAAIEGLGSVIHGKIILIAGGLGKNQDFSPLRDVVAKYVRSVVLIGQDAGQIADALKNITTLNYANSMDDAIIKAKQDAQPGDAVLLSPACASFDMFKNFEDRGDTFMAIVRKLAKVS